MGLMQFCARVWWGGVASLRRNPDQLRALRSAVDEELAQQEGQQEEVAPEPQALVCTDCAVSGDGVASGAARGRLPDMESLSAMAVAALAAPVKPHPLVGVDRSASTADALYFGRI